VPGPLVIILVAPLIVEQLLLRLSFALLTWLQPVVKLLPFTAGQQLVSLAGEASGGDATEVDMLSRWPSGAVFAAFTVSVLAVAAALLRRRDA
jgi:hypothetical protein